MTSPVGALGPRRRALARVGVLAVLLVVAGALPWLAGGSLPVRLIALPLLAAGVLVGLVGLRLRHAVLPGTARWDAPDRPAGSGGCGGCGCGAGGCGAGTAG